MKGRLLIVFSSSHGYVRRYVDILGNALGCDAVAVEKFRGDMLAGYDKILYIGSVRGNVVTGFKKLCDYLDIIYKKLAVCGVGMLPFRKELADKIKSGTISVAYEKLVPTFYVQGGFDAAELTRGERITFNLLVRQIKMANIISEDDSFIVQAATQPFDEVNKKSIQPLIDYLDDKDVDTSLYSPPEITDEAQEKAFFEEQEKAASTSDDKKRALKKKLKK